MEISKDFNEWLIEKNIIGLYGIDTRALVKILNQWFNEWVLTSEDKTVESCLKIINETPNMEGLNLSKVISTKHQYLWRKPTETVFDVEKDILKSQINLKL